MRPQPYAHIASPSLGGRGVAALRDVSHPLIHSLLGVTRHGALRMHGAGVLPAFLVDPAPSGEAQIVAAADLAEWKDTARLAIAARARLPVAAAEEAEIVAFRSADDLREHVALVIGTQDGQRAPLVRPTSHTCAYGAGGEGS